MIRIGVSLRLERVRMELVLNWFGNECVVLLTLEVLIEAVKNKIANDDTTDNEWFGVFFHIIMVG